MIYVVGFQPFMAGIYKKFAQCWFLVSEIMLYIDVFAPMNDHSYVSQMLWG